MRYLRMTSGGGKGFTEWVNMKKAKHLFEGHYQPRIPKDGDYYNLLDNEVKERQVRLAKENGVYGFCFYHYWFNGHMLLEKPMEQYLADEKCDLPFCVCWANEAWTNQWVSAENKVLIAQSYGGPEEWAEHYKYLSQFFKDKRYIKEDNKPFVVIYKPQIIGCLKEMLSFWNEKAKEDGFGGLTFAFQQKSYDKIRSKKDNTFKYAIEYQPMWAQDELRELEFNKFLNFLRHTKFRFFVALEKYFGYQRDAKVIKEPIKQDYDKVWQYIINHKPPLCQDSCRKDKNIAQ